MIQIYVPREYWISRREYSGASPLRGASAANRIGLYLEEATFIRKIVKILLPILLLFPGIALGDVMNPSMVYVGGSVPQWGTNPDTGAQINTAYASCPATGCTIVLVPKSDGSC